ncbi:MAG: succinylglutamate desuccinylase [Alphaproteobacteria bacterium]|jgi:predicted deacylase|nr:succinylglutamate desuccinylase [Alphaproteobacteria bacterium]
MRAKPSRPPGAGSGAASHGAPDHEDRVEIAPPDLEPWRAGNTGIPYCYSFDSGRPGPHAMINALTHGNELSGAIAVDRLLREGVRPAKGRLSLGFANIAAFRRFNPQAPRRSRFVHQDFNRVWAPAMLETATRSTELDRAREMRPLIDTVDMLLDLHSMQMPDAPLILAGPLAKGRVLAEAIGTPALVVLDAGHEEGIRLRDYGGFGDPASPKAAALLEAGQHWSAGSVDVALATCRAFLDALGLVPAAQPPRPPQRVLEVTRVLTIRSDSFRFVRDFDGLESIPEAGTIIAYDGDDPVATPYDDCVLVMPSRRLVRGQTAVRLARDVP